MRQFPNFQGPALAQAKDQQMPTIFWNAKITRVYDLAYIQDVKFLNLESLYNLHR